MKFTVRYHYRREMFKEEFPNSGDQKHRPVGGYDAFFEAKLSCPALPRKGETFEYLHCGDVSQSTVEDVIYARDWDKNFKPASDIIKPVVVLETDCFEDSFHNSTLQELFEIEKEYLYKELVSDLEIQGFKLVGFYPWGDCEKI
jgi:hypothetical protein